MQLNSPGHGAFCAIMIALGVQGVITGQLTAVWEPVPAGVPSHELLAYLCALISLGCGTGLLWRRTRAPAARWLLGFLLLWLLAFRGPPVVQAPTSQQAWSGLGETAVMVAGAWVLYAW